MKTLDQLYLEITLWAEDTFGQDATNAGRVEHLREEVEELAKEPLDRYELADILILVIHHAWANHIDLRQALEEKFKIVRKRKWMKPNEKGVINHVRE